MYRLTLLLTMLAASMPAADVWTLSNKLSVSFAADGAWFRHEGRVFRLSLAGRTGSPVARSGDRVEMEHGGITEWYVNLPGGLEHGFTVKEKLGPLQLELAVAGEYQPVLDARGDVLLACPDGNGVLRYGGLAAWDATGRELPSHTLVAGNRIRLLVDDRGAQYPVTVDPIVREQSLTSSAQELGDQFGSGVAVSGDTIVVGAPTSNGNKGSATVFVRSNGGWVEQTRLIPPTNAENQAFGQAVAISGDLAVIGAPGNYLSTKGAVHVYRRTAGTWNLEATLELQYLSFFGAAVATDGNRIAVYNLLVEDRSNVVIYVRSGNRWVLEPFSLGASPPRPNESYPTIALDGNRVVYGVLSALTQSVVVIRFNGAQWEHETMVSWPLSTSAWKFGASVALSGTTLMVGAPGNSSVIVYSWNNGDGAYQTTLTGPAGSAFGSSIAVSGDVAVVGAPNASGGNGAAYVYWRNGGAWLLKAAEYGTGNAFGAAVATDGRGIVVGVPTPPQQSSPGGPPPRPTASGQALAYSVQNVSILSNPTGRTFTLSGTGCGRTGTFQTPYAGFWSSCSVQWQKPTASTDTRYTWKGWMDGVAGASRDFTLVADPSQPVSSYTGNFAKEFLLTTNTSPQTGGVLSGGDWHAANNTVPVSVAVNPGYVFTGYSGDLTGLTTPQMLLMDGPKTVTANFTTTPPAVLSGIVSLKSGTAANRQWTITVTNQGPGIAYNAHLFGMMFTQVFGTTCTSLPVRLSPAMLPVPIGTLAPGASAVVNSNLDFTGCPTNARFTVSLGYMSNGGASGGVLPLVNQFQ